MRFFPLWPVVQGPDGFQCGCSKGAQCTRIGKHPKVMAWGEAAVEGPGFAPAGIATGRGIVALDVDVKDGKDGFGALQRLRAGRDLPPSWCQRTPSGGVHVLYTYDPAKWSIHSTVDFREKQIGKGLDIRGTGGFVVAPGSLSRNGEPYRLESDALAPAPEWLLQELHYVKPERGAVLPGLEDEDPLFARAVAGFARDMSKATPATKPGGDTHIWHHALRGVRGWGLRSDTAAAILRASPARGDRSDAEIERKCRSAEEQGDTFEPRELLHYALLQDALTEIAAESPPPLKEAKPDAAPFLPPEAVPAPTTAHRLGDIASPKECCTWTAANVADWFARTFPGRLYKDTFLGRVVFERGGDVIENMDAGAGRGFTAEDAGAFQAYLQNTTNRVKATADSVRAAAHLVARMNERDALAEWLLALPWRALTVDEARAGLHAFAVYGWGAAHDDGMARLFAERWFTGAARRGLGAAHNGGRPVDMQLVPVLCGADGGEGKTRGTRALAGYLPAPFHAHALALQKLPDLRQQYECARAMRSKWICEVGELLAMLRDEEHAKDFFTQTEDTNRRMRADETETVERRTVFIATTNDMEPLRRGSVHRRYLPIRVSRVVDVRDIEQGRLHVWACAMRLAMTPGALHYLTLEEERARRVHAMRFEGVDEVEAWLGEWLQGRTPGEALPLPEIRMHASAALGTSVKVPGGKTLASILRRLGCAEHRTATARRWVVPERA